MSLENSSFQQLNGIQFHGSIFKFFVVKSRPFLSIYTVRSVFCVINFKVELIKMSANFETSSLSDKQLSQSLYIDDLLLEPQLTFLTKL